MVETLGLGLPLVGLWRFWIWTLVGFSPLVVVVNLNLMNF